MGKEGMHRTTHFRGDPTYDAVVARFNKEAQEAKQKAESMKPFRVFATIRAIIRKAGYKLMSEIILEDSKGRIFRHGHGREHER